MSWQNKGQMIGQIFVFILAMVILVLIVFFGFKAMAGFQNTGEEVGLVKFETELKSSIKTISLDYGSMRKKIISLPSNYKKLCFIDLSQREKAIAALGQYPIIRNALEDGSDQNIFLDPMAKIEIEVGKITLKTKKDNKYGTPVLCVPIQKGKVELRLEGLGGSAGITG